MPERDYEEITAPQANVNDEQVRIVQWHYPSGSEVAEGAVIAELETAKASFELTADRAGFLHYMAGEGDLIGVGNLIATIGVRPECPDLWSHREEARGEPSTAPAISAKARKLMAEHGLTEAAFAGLERVRVEDVLAMAVGGATKPEVILSGPAARRVEISWRKRQEIGLLSSAARGVVPSTVTVPVETSAVNRAVEDAAKELGIGISRGEWVLFHVARVLRDRPVFNGFFHEGAMQLYDDRDVGLAMNLGRGLKVPVVRRADSLDMKSLVVGVRDLALRYMRNELSPHDLAQPTFVMTDLGSTRVTHFIPVLPGAVAGILGVCAPPPDAACFNLVLTFDHRMADGMEAAEFLGQLQTALQTPLAGASEEHPKAQGESCPF